MSWPIVLTFTFAAIVAMVTSTRVEFQEFQSLDEASQSRDEVPPWGWGTKQCMTPDRKKMHCDGGGCKQANGTCVKGCEAGWWGNYCEMACPSNKCAGGTCDKGTGKCAKGCQKGYWNDDCTKSCPKHCHGKNYQSYGNCDQSTGACTACEKGWGRDSSCSKTCPEHCAGGDCSMEDGKCSSGCEPGWKNDFCNEACLSPEGGKMHCRNGQCTSKGVCRLACDKGYWGDHCSTKCPVNCDTGDCDKKSGACKGECKMGWWNTHCHSACLTPDGSAMKCVTGGGGMGSRRRANCKKADGKCDHCKPEYWGDYCGKACLDPKGAAMNCKNGGCHPQTGACTNGCEKGYWGTHCSLER